jgi:dolichol-phosphate mannosyltransferase
MVAPHPSSPSLSLSVVIPVKDERANIAPLAAEIVAALDGRCTFEAIFVDDGSSDGTRRRDSPCHRAPRRPCARHPAGPQLRPIDRRAPRCRRSPLPLGRHARWRWPESAGRDQHGCWPRCRTVASDPLLLVAGCRLQRNDDWIRRLSSRVANGVRRRMLRDDTPDTGCGLKLFARDTFLQLPYFDHMHRFLPALYQRLGGRVCCVEVDHRPRAAGRSKYGIHNRLWVGIVDLFGVAWLQRRARLSPMSDIE